MAVRTGADYIEGLRDGREVYLDGRRIEDVTAEPGLDTVVQSVAGMYDLAHTDEFRDVLTFENEETERLNGNWIQPRDEAELVQRRRVTETVSRFVGGLYGRAPEYVPLFHLGMLDMKEEFSRGDSRCERAIEEYWQHAREKDLALAHGFVDVQADPNVPVDETVVPRVVAEKEDGLVVRGAKTIATFAPFADEILVGGFPRPGLQDHHVLYFSIPIAWPGVRVVARTPFGEGNVFDHPVAAYGDENDSILILDDVLVPWERLFSPIGDPKFCATVFPRITEWAHWDILARLATKAEVLTGLCASVSEAVGRAKQPQHQEALGEMIRYLLTLRAFVYASEAQGYLTPGGHWMPDPMLVTAGRSYGIEHYRRMIGLLHDVGSQALINSPSEAAFDNEAVGPALEEMFSNEAASARDRARLVRLAFDLACDAYGGRQTLFELFNALPLTAQRGQLIARFDVEPLKQLARAIAGTTPLSEAVKTADLATRPAGIDYEAVGGAYTTYGGQRTRAGASEPKREPDPR